MTGLRRPHLLAGLLGSGLLFPPGANPAAAAPSTAAGPALPDSLVEIRLFQREWTMATVENLSLRLRPSGAGWTLRFRARKHAGDCDHCRGSALVGDDQVEALRGPLAGSVE